MKITARKEIYIERERSVTIRFTANDSRQPRFCARCQADAPFVTVDEAAIARQTTSREIYRLVERDRIHHAETGEGFLLICLASLNETAAIQNQLTTTGEK